MKTASFRGAKFEVEVGDDERGPRHVVHEFPGRADVVAEPSGRFPERFELDCHLVGDGFEAARVKLEAALDEEGPGTLEHPKRGNCKVVVDGPYRTSYSSREGGMYRIRVTFCRVGKPKDPKLSIDTGADLLAKGKSLLSAMRLPRLDTSGFNFIQQAARAVLAGPQSLTRALNQVNSRLRSTIGIVDDFSNAIDDFAQAVNTLINTPDALAIAVQGLINSIVGAVTSIDRNLRGGDTQHPSELVGVALGTLSALGNFGDGIPAVVGDTPARQQQRLNQADLVDLVEASALAETCAALTDLDLDSLDQANEIHEQVGAVFDRLLERGTLDAEAFPALRELQAAFYAHLQALTVDLSALGKYTPQATMSANMIAWKLYGDATRGDEIVRRNPSIEHPGFVHGGVEITVPRA